MTLFFTGLVSIIYLVLFYASTLQLILGSVILRKKSMVFVYTAMGVLCVEHAMVNKQLEVNCSIHSRRNLIKSV